LVFGDIPGTGLLFPFVFSFFNELILEGVYFFGYHIYSDLESFVAFLLVGELDPLVFEFFFVMASFFNQLAFGLLELVFGPFEVVFEFEFAAVHFVQLLLQVLHLGGFVVVSLGLNWFEKQHIFLRKVLFKQFYHVLNEHRNLFLKSALKQIIQRRLYVQHPRIRRRLQLSHFIL
jgi:hypothetical protein